MYRGCCWNGMLSATFESEPVIEVHRVSAAIASPDAYAKLSTTVFQKFALQTLVTDILKHLGSIAIRKPVLICRGSSHSYRSKRSLFSYSHACFRPRGHNADDHIILKRLRIRVAIIDNKTVTNTHTTYS